jgi:hypothetical protein
MSVKQIMPHVANELRRSPEGHQRTVIGVTREQTRDIWATGMRTASKRLDVVPEMCPTGPHDHGRIRRAEISPLLREPPEVP